MKEIPPLPSVTNIAVLLQELTPGSRLVDMRLLDGSFSNSTAVITAVNPANHTQQLVVRCYAIFGNYDRGEKAQREFETLKLLAAHQIPAPEPLFLDMTGETLGSPGIVTSFVAGRQVIDPEDVTGWVQELAQTLARIHAIPVTAVEHSFLLDAQSEVTWFCRSERTPDYMQAHPAGETIWRGVRHLLPMIQPVPPSLVHVDYWTGNILWADGKITAVLDWEEAAWGDPGYDVAYIRAELALLGGLPLADQFLKAYEAACGRAVVNLPLWELAAAVRFMENPAGMIPEWQTFSNGEWNAAQVKQNFADFIASSIQQLPKGYPNNRVSITNQE